MKEEIKKELDKMDIQTLRVAWYLLDDQPKYVEYIKSLIKVKIYFQELPKAIGGFSL